MQKEVLRVLLDTLMEKELIAKSTYDGAVNLVNSHMDFPEFFWYPVCCQGKEDEDDGCTQDPS